MSKRTVSMWSVLFIVLIIPILFELGFHHENAETIWLVYLFSAIFFPYYYGMKKGVVLTVLLVVLPKLVWEIAMHTDNVLEFHTEDLILFISTTLLVGYFSNKIKNKTTKLELANEELSLMNELLKNQEFEMRNIIMISPHIILIHQDGKIVFANPSAITVAGVQDEKDLIGKSIFSFITTDEQSNQAKEAIQEIFLKGREEQFTEYQIVSTTGEIKWLEIMGRLTTFHGKDAIMIIAKDVTEKKRSMDKITKLAYHDSLTGLPNRMKLLELEQKFQSKHVLFLDLDRFKFINDSLGHHFGDILLRKIGDRLKQTVGSIGEVYRYAGDEFIILMYEGDQIQLARNIISTLTEPFYLNDHEIYISTSIGISSYPKDGENLKELIKNADVAMYVAKEQGRNNYHLYDPSYRLKNERRVTLENGLRKALQNEELTIHYQPQVDLLTGKMVGMEALLRWEHPELGRISPMEFIPIAEETDLITQIGSWVLMKACEQAVAWQKEGYPPITLAVNISARQLQTKYKFVQTVKAILGITKLEPSLLELEVTEGMMKDIQVAMPVLQELKELGIQVSIDDFGTGYSALSVLSQFPVDKLKIDQSFIRESLNSPITASLIKTIIAMGHNLNFNVIAEGIETKDQLAFLKENKCNAGQGYLYSRPLPPEELAPLLKQLQISV